MAKKTRQSKIWTAVKTDARFACNYAWFATVEDADTFAAFVARHKHQYVGGYFDGMPCGRESSHDYIDAKTGLKVYAVSCANLLAVVTM